MLAGAGFEAVCDAGADDAGADAAGAGAAPPATAGWQAAAAKTAAAAEIARLCGGLPLCLSVASSMMALHPMDWQTRASCRL